MTPGSPGRSSPTEPSLPSLGRVLEGQARLTATGWQDILVLRSDPYKTELRFTPLVGGNPEAAHMEAATHQDLLEFLARLSRPHCQTPLFAQRAATGLNSFATVQAAIS